LSEVCYHCRIQHQTLCWRTYKLLLECRPSISPSIESAISKSQYRRRSPRVQRRSAIVVPIEGLFQWDGRVIVERICLWWGNRRNRLLRKWRGKYRLFGERTKDQSIGKRRKLLKGKR